MSTANKPDAARGLLLRATQSVEEHQHRTLTSKFAALEFQSINGEAERGRTIFEGLLSTFPKKVDLWDMYIDLEKSRGNIANTRVLFERMCNTKMKQRRAKFVFKRWLEFEEFAGQAEDVQRVKALATEYVQKLKQENDEDDELA
jgi:rRNA biogenesis protein RRP5